MPTQTVRARFHAGHLEPLEALSLVEGSEVTVTIDVPNPPHAKRRTLSVWDLGAPQNLTRKDYYDGAE